MQVSPCEAVWDMRLAAGKKRNATKGRRILWYLQVPFLKKNKKNIIKSEDWLYKEVTVIKSLTFRERENSHLPSGHYPERSGLEVHDRRTNRRLTLVQKCGQILSLFFWLFKMLEQWWDPKVTLLSLLVDLSCSVWFFSSRSTWQNTILN